MSAIPPNLEFLDKSQHACLAGSFQSTTTILSGDSSTLTSSSWVTSTDSPSGGNMKPPDALINQYNAVRLLFTIVGSVIGVVVVAAVARMILKGICRRSSHRERSTQAVTLGNGSSTLGTICRPVAVLSPGMSPSRRRQFVTRSGDILSPVWTRL